MVQINYHKCLVHFPQSDNARLHSNPPKGVKILLTLKPFSRENSNVLTNTLKEFQEKKTTKTNIDHLKTNKKSTKAKKAKL